MEFGAIPVYISDVFSLPFSDEIDWENTIVMCKVEKFTVDDKELLRLFNRLKALSEDEEKIKKYRENVRFVYQKFLNFEGASDAIIKRVSI
jgi:hypothetical protein